MEGFDHKSIESKWKEIWSSDEIYKTPDFIEGKENEYVLVEFPYPSGDLHVGHWYAFAITDIFARYQRLQGKNVLFPVGFDAFGLPAENAAIKKGLNPREWTYKNMETMKDQLKSMGASFDWSRQIASCDPEYYKWTQYLFLKLYEAGLVEKKISLVNWDPVDKTVLANEQVLPDGTAERSGAVVEKKEMEQWSIKITKYADRLIDDLDVLEWPNQIKEAQKNWIGRSKGAEIDFKITDTEHSVKVFTTRPDTLFGVTYVVLAPEHKLVEELISKVSNKDAVQEYVETTKRKLERERLIGVSEKTGVVLEGVFAINPANNEQIPVYIADYVLASYGTGAVMAVPAHDERDFEFAEKFGLPVRKVVDNSVEEKAYTGEGILINSGEFDGLPNEEAKEKIVEKVGGQMKSTYRLRDWTVSRQRYWGCPIPMINCSSCGPVPEVEENLPVVLPEISDYLPRDDGKSPLAKATDWMHTKCPKCGADAERETDTLDTFVDSSWYYLRYADPKNTEQFADQEKLKKWMPINFYSGGSEHTTMHLLFARFFNKALFDLKLSPVSEPFKYRLNRGLIAGTDGNKMSKSKGNVINPDEQVEKFGADTVRVYLAFIGPYNEPGSYPWDPNGIVGARRFLERIFQIDQKITDTTPETVKKALHKAIKKVSEDMSRLKFNTAISELMILTNEIFKNGISKDDAKIVAQQLSPIAPFAAEELWQKLGGENSVHTTNWPQFEASILIEDQILIPVQINGKIRAQVSVKNDITEEEIRDVVLEDDSVKKWIEGSEVKKLIYVPGKLVSVVI
jgi:leucyl-tRNA synthetase